ncbi:hypothetical protein [Streptomyces fagopyri]|uniref:hypothetical protein n=1 Tax=Streptomyces fagopyri TaxID=2662397 RepID=UPI003800135E
MLGLTTTRRLRAVEADYTAQLNQAWTSAELERRRADRTIAAQKRVFRRRLDRALKAVAATRKDAARAQGALRRVTERLVDMQKANRTVGGSR